MYAAILAGGKGRRFWPASRLRKPKQFLDITGRGTMLSLTWRRLASIIPERNIFVLTVEDQVGMVKEEIPSLPESRIFAEPSGRNTAPSLAVGTIMAMSNGGDEPILCCPADHLITDERAFIEAVARAERAAAGEDVLVTFGVEPTGPSTGYGYIEGGEDLGGGVFSVSSFREKPDRSTAERFLEEGCYYWNSGIFLWRPSVFIDAWNRFLPEGQGPLSKVIEASGKGTSAVMDAARSVYGSMPAISVDYAILERASNVVVCPSIMGWSDVGSWDALEGIVPRDGFGNSVVGDSVSVDSKGNILYNPEGFTAAVGVEGLIVAVSKGTVLVCRKGDSQRVRRLLDKIEEDDREDLL